MTTSPLTIPQKLDRVENQLLGRLMERRRHCETAVTALVAKGHHCQYGPPGTGKTMLVDILLRLIDNAVGFRWLMTRFTTPEELFGMFSIRGMENDEYVRKLTGKMVPSQVAFLDEIFKANSAILNALLTLMNEGLFFNGTSVVQARPIIFCGSNELPKDAELAALWDRVTFRLETKPLREPGNVSKMLQAKARAHLAAQEIVPEITWAEIVQAQHDAELVDVADEVFNALLTLKGKLKSEGIEPTDRRWNDCIPIIKAAAYRDGASVADVDHMGILRHVLWNQLAEIPTVEKLVLELANPLDKEALTLIEEVDRLAGEVDKIINDHDNEQARRRKGIEVNAKLTRASEELDALMDKVKKSPKRSEMVDEARQRLSSVVERLLKELFDIDKKDI